jgi:RNA polymerase-binding transcription factor DksA
LPEFERNADPLDIAADNAERILQSDLHRQRQESARSLHPAWRRELAVNPEADITKEVADAAWNICVDCDEDIQPGRVQMRFARCISCQETHEHRGKLLAR